MEVTESLLLAGQTQSDSVELLSRIVPSKFEGRSVFKLLLGKQWRGLFLLQYSLYLFLNYQKDCTG